MQAFCGHLKIEMIARRGGIDYVRCRDCGQVMEADDLEPAGGQRDEEREEAGV
jgi:uncharacterized Zn finger protein